MGKDLFFQQLQKVFTELGYLWRDHCLTIGLELIAREIFLVIILCHVELIERGHFGDDGFVPDILRVQILD